MQLKDTLGLAGAGLLLLGCINPLISVSAGGFSDGSNIFGCRQISSMFVIYGLALVVLAIMSGMFVLKDEFKSVFICAIASAVVLVFIYITYHGAKSDFTSAMDMGMNDMGMPMDPQFAMLFDIKMYLSWGWAFMLGGTGLLGAACFLQRGEVSGAFNAPYREYKISNKAVKYWLQMAEEHTNAQRFDEAIQAYTRLIDMHPNPADMYFKRGILHQVKGDLASAKQDVQTAADMDHPQAAAHIKTLR